DNNISSFSNLLAILRAPIDVIPITSDILFAFYWVLWLHPKNIQRIEKTKNQLIAAFHACL
ncbi:MAG: hypothetical protein KKF44_06175, partial [Nanoarchaeota archaeon]|nr:hypothetical protein [Nanoarchaeota archaeon]